MIIRIIAIIVVSMMPIFLSISLYNAITCNNPNDKNYQAWLAQGNKGTITDMTKSCNILHPTILFAIIPTSPILGYITWWMTKKDHYTDNTSNQRLRS